MSEPILAAIIGAVATVFAVFLSKWLKNDRPPPEPETNVSSNDIDMSKFDGQEIIKIRRAVDSLKKTTYLREDILGAKGKVFMSKIRPETLSKVKGDINILSRNGLLKYKVNNSYPRINLIKVEILDPTLRSFFLEGEFE